MTAPTDALRRDTDFAAWGEPGSSPTLGSATLAALTERLGELTPGSRAPLSEVRLPSPARIPASLVDAAGGDGAVSTEPEDRARHAAGSGYPDLVRLRAGAPADAPDAVLAPGSREAVAAILATCSRERIAVVPFGGGTSVVGGVEPTREGFDRLVALDLAALREVEIDPGSAVAHLGPGLRGPEAEAAVARAGFTIGHFPQSYRYATIGGFAATRSAGQASTGYGRFDKLVTTLGAETPVGRLETLLTPHTAAGPSLRELMLGSEGILGVITDVGVRLHPLPEEKLYEGWFVPGFEAGTGVIRALAREQALPDVIRLSDREETEMSLLLSGLEGLKRSALERYLRLRRMEDGCMLIAGWEGTPESVARRRELSRRVFREHGAATLGRSPGDSWAHGRFDGPHLRDALMDLGVMVETLETSHVYSGVEELYAAVRAAIRGAISGPAGPGIVMCHVSHAYGDGISLYFTFLAAARAGAEIEQWSEVKQRACVAIGSAGGTITHHHAVGRDHAPFMGTEIGPVGIEALRAVKDRLDPAGVMNPGKLLPPA